MKIRDLKIGMQIKSLGDGKVETIRKIEYNLGAVITERNMYWSFKYGKEWELYVPQFDGPQDAITHLKAEDYRSLLALAVEFDDKKWFEEICQTINSLKAGEQLA